MDALEMQRETERHLAEVLSQIEHLRAEEVGLRAQAAHWRTVARQAKPEPRETLKDAIVRVVVAAGREVTAHEVVRLLAEDGISVDNQRSASTMLGQLAKGDGPLQALRRGWYVARRPPGSASVRSEAAHRSDS